MTHIGNVSVTPALRRAISLCLRRIASVVRGYPRLAEYLLVVARRFPSFRRTIQRLSDTAHTGLNRTTAPRGLEDLTPCARRVYEKLVRAQAEKQK